jgi:hypothetical protein
MAACIAAQYAAAPLLLTLSMTLFLSIIAARV